VTLYHGTEHERAARILVHGFRESDETALRSHRRIGVLLYRHPDAWTHNGRLFVDVLLAVQLAIPEAELVVYTDPADADAEGGPLYWVPAIRCRGARVTVTAKGTAT
jgi:hypothetical protein